MNITGIGINADGGRLNGSLHVLEEDLAFFQQCGFDAVEISTHGLDLVIRGRVYQARLDQVRAITERYPFAYTIHAVNRLNLAFGPEHELEKDVFAATLDICAALGARMMVYHSGLIALERVGAFLRPLPHSDELERAREREVTALRELMPLAAERDVVVAMENRDPHPWEVAVLRREGRDPAELCLFHGGLLIPNLVAQVQAVAHPNLGICLDLAHLFLATNHLGLDYLEAVRQAAPWVRHIHANDNFGVLGDAFTGLADRNPYGEGDLHLPPGWGAIPLADALAQLSDYQGMLILELRPRYRAHFADALATTRSLIAQATG